MKQESRIKKYLFIVPMLAALSVGNVVYAQLPAGNAITLDEIGSLTQLLARFLIVMSMIFAVIFIVLSGIMVMAAQANPTKFKAGLDRLKHAAYGVAVVLATGVIINTIGTLVDRSFFCQISFLGICLY